MIARSAYLEQLAQAVGRSPVTALLGPRQCGKTTLAQRFAEGRTARYFDLESQPDRRRLQNPELMLGALEGIAILDEIQEMPELFKVLRVLVDRPQNQARFSDSRQCLAADYQASLLKALPDVWNSSSSPASMSAKPARIRPRACGCAGDFRALSSPAPMKAAARGAKASSGPSWNETSLSWASRFLPQPCAAFGPCWLTITDKSGMRRIWLAPWASPTKPSRSYLDILTGGLHGTANCSHGTKISGKRQVKAPKIYLRDSGILHALLSLTDRHSLSGHPRVGASWEGFALEQTLHTIKVPEPFFWATHSGAELDLFFLQSGRRFGVEFKFSEAPKVTKSDAHDHGNAAPRSSMDHPLRGCTTIPWMQKIWVWPLSSLAELPEQIRAHMLRD